MITKNALILCFYPESYWMSFSEKGRYSDLLFCLKRLPITCNSGKMLKTF